MAEVEKNTTWNPIVIMSAHVRLAEPVLPAAHRPGPDRRRHAHHPVRQGRQRRRRSPTTSSSSCSTRRLTGAGPRRQADDLRHRLDLRLVHGRASSRRRRRTRAASTAATSCSRPATSTPRTRCCSTASTSRRTASRTPTSTRAARWPVYEVSDPAQLGTFVPDGDLLDNNGGIGNYDDFLEGAGG